MLLTIKTNKEFNGIELYFDCKPANTIIEALKNLKFRWHSVKRCWYAKDTEQNRKFAEGLTTTQKAPAKSAEVEKVGKLGVRVGDVFVASWGYEQTNLTFVRVVKLSGSQSVRVVEVSLAEVSEEAVCGMSRDVAFNKNEYVVKNSSVFIKDQEQGDLFRIKDWGNGTPCIKLESFAYALPYNGQKLYESWYY